MHPSIMMEPQLLLLVLPGCSRICVSFRRNEQKIRQTTTSIGTAAAITTTAAAATASI